MTGHLVQADGAPCPTLVLDADTVPPPWTPGALRPLLSGVRRWLAAAGRGHVLKIALVSPSAQPGADLDYLFVQCLPGGTDRFDFTGSCGHSMVAAVVAARAQGILRRGAGARVGIRVLNNGDRVDCEIAPTGRRSAVCALYFRPGAGQLLPTGRPLDRVTAGGRRIDVSLVSMGNPYVFVDARDLGLDSAAELLGAGDGLLWDMARVRLAAARLAGRPLSSVFPKIAAVAPNGPGSLAARAISVPGWHPTLALTGATCLAAATTVPGTVPARLLAGPPAQPRQMVLRTPGGVTDTVLDVSGAPGAAVLHRVGVAGKRARVLAGPLDVPVLREPGLCERGLGEPRLRERDPGETNLRETNLRGPDLSTPHPSEHSPSHDHPGKEAHPCMPSMT